MARRKSDPLLKVTLLCRACGEQKGQDAFTPSDWRKYITSGECRSCRRLYSKRRYQRDAASMKERREDRQAVVHALKAARGCRDCGEKHPACLDFHHRDRDDKEYGVGVLTAGGYPMETLLAEIEKCDVLCSNCHRKHHWNEKRTASERDPNVLPFRVAHSA